MDLPINFPQCCDQTMHGVEYACTSQDYDGISEFKCETCGRRVGRWSKRELGQNEIERRYGGEPVAHYSFDTRG